MTTNKLIDIINQGESRTVEFKTCKNKLNKDAFESICAFLNRNGGHLFLGVKDSGEISGIDEDAIQGILDTIVTMANNPQKLNPPYYLSPKVIEIKDKKVIVVYIPESSRVHYTVGKIYDRNEDGDFDITNQSDQVTQLFLRKQSTFSENKVFPFVKISDFDEAILNV